MCSEQVSFFVKFDIIISSEVFLVDGNAVRKKVERTNAKFVTNKLQDYCQVMPF